MDGHVQVIHDLTTFDRISGNLQVFGPDRFCGSGWYVSDHSPYSLGIGAGRSWWYLLLSGRNSSVSLCSGGRVVVVCRTSSTDTDHLSSPHRRPQLTRRDGPTLRGSICPVWRYCHGYYRYRAVHRWILVGGHCGYPKGQSTSFPNVCHQITPVGIVGVVVQSNFTECRSICTKHPTRRLVNHVPKVFGICLDIPRISVKSSFTGDCSFSVVCQSFPLGA